MYERALPYFEKANDPLGQGNVYRSIGDIYFYTGENEKAMKMYERALPYFEKANDPLGQGNVYRSIGDIYFYTGEMEKAMKMYERAEGFYNRVGDIEDLGYTMIDKARVFAKEDKDKEAMKYYEDAISKFERVRRQTGFSELKRSFMESVIGYYEEVTLFMLNKGYNEKGFYYAESMKSRVFLDQLAEGLVQIEKGIDPELKRLRDEVESKISRLNKEKIEEYQKNSQDKENKEERIKSIEEELKKAEEELERIKVKIRLTNPLYASVEYPEPVSVKVLQREVLKSDEVMIEYFVSKDGVYAFLITDKTFEVVNLGKKKGNIDGDIQSVIKSVTPHIEGNKLKLTEFNRGAAMRLYEILLKPFENRIKGRRLIIVPDGNLSRLPFEILMVNDSKYVVEEYSVKYVQSASVLYILRTKYKQDGLSDSFVGFGDPVYDYGNYIEKKAEYGTPEYKDGQTTLAQRGYIRAGGKLNRLVGSGEEVKGIGEMFKGKKRDAKTYLRIDAREENAKGMEMDKYGYIHFSVHGLVNDKFQALALSQIPNAKEDGMLSLGEIMNLKYNARMIVLSACESGLGKEERGEGVTGLTRAFMYAGSPAVVVSLWSVDDEGTMELMKRLYGNILEKGLSKERSIRDAKLDMLKNTKFRHPFFWGAFVIYGE
jgi:CHAT domain-containing protein/Tfp pilus assembly protein PilF